uniref:Uncharacterized protein n=1 Tax=Panagrellus redivivus TaxID=6233 RepID=A0A7E4V396_PANRE
MDSLSNHEANLRAFFAVSENFDAVVQHQTYDRNLVQILRDANKAFKIYKCPVPDERLKRLGLDRQPIPEINYYKVTKYRKSNPLWNPFKEVKRPEPEKLTMSNDDILFVESALKKLRPSTFASIANSLISKNIWKYPDAAEIIINAAMALGSATIYADLVYKIQRAEMLANGTTTFSQMASKIAAKRFKAILNGINEKSLMNSEYIFNAISVVAELYRLHIIENLIRIRKT